MNDEIKFIHQKRSNKQDPMVNDLKSRKRMEILIETNCEGQKGNVQNLTTYIGKEQFAKIMLRKKTYIF